MLASTQKTKKENQAGHSPERAVEGPKDDEGGDGELRNKNPPTPCVWQVPACPPAPRKPKGEPKDDEGRDGGGGDGSGGGSMSCGAAQGAWVSPTPAELPGAHATHARPEVNFQHHTRTPHFGMFLHVLAIFFVVEQVFYLTG